MALMQDDKYLITGSIDHQLIIWKISQKSEEHGIENKMQYLSLEVDADEEIEDNTVSQIRKEFRLTLKIIFIFMVFLVSNKLRSNGHNHEIR